MKYIPVLMVLCGCLLGADGNSRNSIAETLIKMNSGDPSAAKKGLIAMLDEKVDGLTGMDAQKYINEKLIENYKASAKSGMQAVGFLLDDDNVAQAKEIIESSYKLDGFEIPYKNILVIANKTKMKNDGREGVLWVCYDSQKSVGLVIITIVNSSGKIIVFDAFHK